MIQRRTQTEAFWREQFAPSSQDLSRTYDLVLEAGRPVGTADLALSLIDHHCRTEESQVQADLSRGPAYQPKDSYELGQEITFPALDYAWGTVVGARPAHSPDCGDFTAIQVRLEGQSRLREFASGLRGDHRLNREGGLADLLAASEAASPAELHERYGAVVEAKLDAELARHPEFVRVGGGWFLRELLVDIGIGQLNIAEALIEIKSMPLPTAELLSDLDMPAEVPEEIRLLSLKLALEADQRFDNVGDSGRDVWYLGRLTPPVVVQPPSGLMVRVPDHDRHSISRELLLLERELDETGAGDDAPAAGRPIYRTSLALTYPHWSYGTLPLTARTQGLFPRATGHHTPIVLVDGQSGERMQGWVVPQQAFVFGLRDWYQRYSLPVGAILKLERTRDPRVIQIDYEPQRLRRVWVRVVSLRQGVLSFQMRKLPASCDFDEQLIVAADDAGTLEEYRAEMEGRGVSLAALLLNIMPELVKLSPQATVHAKTVYATANLLRRLPPAPVFALLSTVPCFVPMGGGYYTYDQTRVPPGLL